VTLRPDDDSAADDDRHHADARIETKRPGYLANFTFEEVESDDGDKNKRDRVGLSAPAIARLLSAQSEDWPRRVGSALFVPDGDHGPLWLTKVHDLFGWIQSLYPENDGQNVVHWAERSTGMVSRSEFHAYLQQTATRYEAVESSPHEPPLPGHYYIHPALEGGDGTALAGLLARFTPYSEDDAELIRAFFLTLVWGGEYGKRPAFLITGPDEDPEMGRGTGKTTIVRLASRLVGGTFDVRPNDDWTEVMKRLLSNTACSTQRVILIDNVKSSRFSWADVEAVITAERINGRKLFVGDGARPNTFLVAITLNGASLSKDLSQRSVIIKLDRPKYAGDWEEQTAEYIAVHRWAILGGLVAHLQRPVKMLPSFSRWGDWERDVLGRLAEPERLQNLICERRGAVDDDDDEADLIREAIVDELRVRGHGDAAICGVRITAAVMTDIVNRALNERLTTTSAGTKLKSFAGAIKELRKGIINGRKVWLWCGENYPANAKLWPLNDLPEHLSGRRRR
jgi:hypothetical protein